MQHFVVPADAIRAGAISFSPAQAHQIARVLRLRSGDEVVVLDGAGQQYRVQLTVTGTAVAGEILDVAAVCHEPERRVTLVVAPPKGERWAWLLQKGTEIGVARFRPVVARYSQPGTAVVRGRHHEIVREATEQCRRLLVPSIVQPCPLAHALRDLVAAEATATVLLWEGMREREHDLSLVLRPALQTGLRHINLVIGPEGGFHPDEVALARELDIVIAGLGPLILRSETAGVVAATIALLG